MCTKGNSATLNTTEIAAQMGQAEENYLKAKRDAQRVQNLYCDSVSTKEQLENTQTALGLAERQLDIVKFNLIADPKSFSTSRWCGDAEIAECR